MLDALSSHAGERAWGSWRVLWTQDWPSGRGPHLHTILLSNLTDLKLKPLGVEQLPVGSEV